MTPIPTYAALLAFMRAQLKRLNVTLGSYEAYAGWAESSVAHVLNGDKYLSGPSQFVALNAMGCTLHVAEDAALVERFKRSSCYAPNNGSPAARRPVQRYQILVADAKITGRQGGLARAKLGPQMLSKINRKAALTRKRRAREATT